MPMVLFAKLIILAIAKKVIAYGIARTYGIPKLYRRSIKLNHRLLLQNHPAMAAKTQRLLRISFRFPNTIYDWATRIVRKYDK